MRKHPVMLGMLILIILGVFSYFFFYKAGLYSGKSRSFSLKDKIGVVMPTI